MNPIPKDIEKTIMSDQYTSRTKNVGNFRCETTYVRGDGRFATDLPKEIGGLSEYPTPMELLASAVASCMMSMVSYVASRKGISMENMKFQAFPIVESDKLKELNFIAKVPHPVDLPERELLEKSAMSCPVKNALDPNIKVSVECRWEGN